MSEYDVIIVGAGVAGLSTAAALSKRGLRVAVIDKGSVNAIKTGECLMADALPIMARLGLSEAFLAAKHQSLQSYQVAWGEQDMFERHLLTSPTGAGWIVNRPIFDGMLVDHCVENQVILYWRSALEHLEKTATNQWQLSIKGVQATNLTARFVIDGSGRSRALTQRLGINKQRLDKMVASCCHVNSECELSSASATIASDQHGWWYYAKFSPHQGSLAYFTDSDLPLPAHGKDLLAAATKHNILAPLLTDANAVTETFKRCGADSSALQSCVGDGWLAIGDAAYSFDPLSSYGMTSALASAFYASQALLRYFADQPQYLQTYQQLCQNNFMTYLAKRQQEYQKVDPATSVFWQRRHAGTLLSV
jgi:flavin-dependent dehydrogenase